MSQPGGGSGAATGTPSTAAPPARRPTIVDGVVGAGATVTRQLLDSVGTAATQLLETVRAAVDRILPLGLQPTARAVAAHPLLAALRVS